MVFRITTKRRGAYPAIVTVNGLLSEGCSDTFDWESVMPSKYKRRAWLHLDWEAKSLKDLSWGLPILLRKTRKGIAAVLVIAWVFYQWVRVLVNSKKTGELLAERLRRREGKQFVLMGNSLGARVIYYALLALATTNDQIVQDVHLLGGAVGNRRDDWRRAKQAVTNKIYNYYSTQDSILRYMYSVGTFFASRPIGRNKIERTRGINNIDVSSVVKGHSLYKRQSMMPYIRT